MKTALAAALILSAALAPLAASQARAADVTIPIIVKDTTSPYWQIVLAGARKAGKDLGVKVPELGAQSESDINGQISILENAVAGKPAAVVISPTEFTALGKPIDEAAKSVPDHRHRLRRRLQGLHLVPDHRQRARAAASPPTASPTAIKAKTGKAEGRRRPDHLAAGRRLARPARARASRKSSRPSIPT